MKLLHIVASPRGEKSNTMRVSAAFRDSLSKHHENVVVETVDLYHHDLPAIAGDNIEAKYTLMVGQQISKDHAESWAQIERAITHFLSADAYLISTPMWNFSIPYALKYYIDCIVQPGYLFTYNEIGQAVPLVHGKKMICISSRGGDYSPGTAMNVFDFQEPYLRAIFGFIGITDLQFISAQPMDITQELRERAVDTAVAQAADLASRPDWAAATADRLRVNPAGLKPQPLVDDAVRDSVVE